LHAQLGCFSNEFLCVVSRSQRVRTQRPVLAYRMTGQRVRKFLQTCQATGERRRRDFSRQRHAFAQLDQITETFDNLAAIILPASDEEVKTVRPQVDACVHRRASTKTFYRKTRTILTRALCHLHDLFGQIIDCWYFSMPIRSISDSWVSSQSTCSSSLRRISAIRSRLT